jgi:transcription initiation factor TFIID subunit TAF12
VQQLSAINMGLLEEKQQLKETVGSLEARLATLIGENIRLSSALIAVTKCHGASQQAQQGAEWSQSTGQGPSDQRGQQQEHIQQQLKQERVMLQVCAKCMVPSASWQRRHTTIRTACCTGLHSIDSPVTPLAEACHPLTLA